MGRSSAGGLRLSAILRKWLAIARHVDLNPSRNRAGIKRKRRGSTELPRHSSPYFGQPRALSSASGTTSACVAAPGRAAPFGTR